MPLDQRSEIQRHMNQKLNANNFPICKYEKDKVGQ